MRDVLTTIARPGPVLTKSGFSGYDACINPYVGCEFGCTYCYVRFFVTDPQREWGEFVRVREHLVNKLPRELDSGRVKLGPNQFLPIDQCRLVIGTMTDPYQPAEKTHQITRTALQLLVNHRHQFQKVGIFTRSPLVLEDLDLIARLPRARVHFTVTPFQPEVLRAIEPISPVTARRWEVIRRIRQAGIRVHANISPVMPQLSEQFTDEFCQRLVELGVSEFFVDPMQPYQQAFAAFETALQGDARWPQIRDTMLDRERYTAWKHEYRAGWERAWRQYGTPVILPIWSDHESRTWVDMRTGQDMDRRQYGEEAV